MAIVGITPTFMSPLAFRDSSQQLAQASRDNAAAVQNAFKFGTQVYDMFKNRAIGNALAEGDTNKAAQLESQKLNNADPSSFWRWNKGQEMQQAQINEAKEQREADKQAAKNALLNEKQSVLDTVTSENPEAKIQFINNLNTMKAKLATNGIDTSDIDERIKQETANLNSINNKTKQALAANRKIEESAKHLGNIKELDAAGIEEYLTQNQGLLTDADLQKAMVILDAKKRAETLQRRGDILNTQNFYKAQKEYADSQQLNDIKF